MNVIQIDMTFLYSTHKLFKGLKGETQYFETNQNSILSHFALIYDQQASFMICNNKQEVGEITMFNPKV